ncbi:uncharacterized protein J8A68_003511 [[Candida] subhashii]|uniref:Kinesin motor domain-containing protein n=1 Tax=[Candida] subhashii TaxID=561895 RepID=A0A8J5QDM3_9ASCO|nr:uncharacterized protein J8A68_003511 [[Candida] subhashii]KAG7662961.1 hypothetical protein J8A68_003511 [[Candida] subhashii]
MTSSIPLYLKIKGCSNNSNKIDGEQQPEFKQTSSTTIEFNEKPYEFNKIYSSETKEYPELIQNKTSCIILLGPTDSGKTTMLKELVFKKVKSLQGSTFITSFEVTNNKYILDLLDENSRKRVPLANFESHLKRQKVNETTIESILKKRLTRATDSNPNSSRSCLVVTLYNMGHHVTMIDMMGNEKSTGMSNGSIFANTNISSITQLLASKTYTVRSSNFLTNLIFRNKDLQVVMHLDPFGDVSLIRSTLVNVADMLKSFKLTTSKFVSTQSNNKVPNYARPTLSSKLISTSKKIVRTSPVKGSKMAVSRTVHMLPSSPIKQIRREIKPSIGSTFFRSEKLEAENIKLNLELENLKNLVKVKEEVNLELSEKNKTQQENLVVELEQIKIDFAQLKTDYDLTINNIQTLETSNKELIVQADQLQNEFSYKEKQLKGQLEDKSKDIESLTSDIQNLKQQAGGYELELQETKTKYEQLRVSKEEEQSKLNELVDSKDKEIDNTSKLLKEATDKVSKLEEKIHAQQLEISSLTYEIIDIKDNHRAAIKQVEESHKREIENLSNSHKTEIEGLENDYQSETKKSENISNELINNMAELVLLKGQLKDQYDLHQEVVSSKETEISHLKGRLSDEQQKSTKLEEALNENATTIKALENSLQSSRDANRTASELEEELDRIRKENANSKAALQEAREFKEKSIEKFKYLNARLEEKSKSLETLMKDQQEMKTKITADLDKSAEKVSQLTQQLQEAQETIQKLKNNDSAEQIAELRRKSHEVVEKFKAKVQRRDDEITKLTEQLKNQSKSSSISTNMPELSPSRTTSFSPHQIYQDKVVLSKPSTEKLNGSPKEKEKKVLKPSSKLNSSPIKGSGKHDSSPLKILKRKSSMMNSPKLKKRSTPPT